MNEVISGHNTRLIKVEVDDAEDIIKLRNNPSINKYLSTTREITVETQRKWIVKNAEKNEWNLKITDKEYRFCGTISLYNILNESAEFGRYISVNPFMAIEAEYLLLKFGFEKLQLKSIYCKTILESKRVWNQHYKFGFKDMGTEVNPTLNKQLIVQEITNVEFVNFDYSFVAKYQRLI